MSKTASTLKETLIQFGRKMHILPSAKTSKPRDEYGREIPDPRPLELVLNLKNAVKSNNQVMLEMIQVELNKLARARGYESLDEANDFNMADEDSAVLSGHEIYPEMEAELAAAMEARRSNVNPENAPPPPVKPPSDEKKVDGIK